MKKTLILIVLIAGVALAWAAPPDRLPSLLTPPVEARTVVVVAGSVPAAPASDCPAGTYAFAWNGEHSSGVDYACFNSGASSGVADATAGTMTTGADYAQAGNNGVHIDQANESWRWVSPTTVGSVQIIDDEAFTIWFHARAANEDTSSAVYFLESRYDSSDYIYTMLRTNDDIQVVAHGAGTEETAFSGGNISDGNWHRIGVSCTTSTAKCATSLDGAAWSEAASATYTAWTSGDPPEFRIGENSVGTATTAYIDVDNIYILLSYQAADPML